MLRVMDTRELLERAGLTRYQAARLLGVKVQVIERWMRDPKKESSRKMPEPERRLLLLLADVRGAKGYIESLIRDEENEE